MIDLDRYFHSKHHAFSVQPFAIFKVILGIVSALLFAKLAIFFGRLVITEICKAPTLRLKALNKQTHIMYIEMENVIKKEQKKKSFF